MTKLVRKLKQMAKKRAHRKTVQKRKAERAMKGETEESQELKKEELLDLETERELSRLTGQPAEEEITKEEGEEKKIVKVVGGLVLETAKKKAKKQMSRRQVKRKEKNQERGEAVVDRLGRKWDFKKRRVKQRAQIRNENLHN